MNCNIALEKKKKKIAILQSDYIPWKGYFDIINSVDEFIIYDEAQYTRRDWRNRNLIKTRNGLRWLTIPIKSKGRFSQKICETEIHGKSWAEQHYKTICHNYGAALHFGEYVGIFREVYQAGTKKQLLSEVNRQFIEVINNILGIKTKISYSSDYIYSGNRGEKILSICQQARAAEYITGPAARSYIDTRKFEESGIGIHWMDYSGYSEYRQLYPPFIHNVSIIDLVFNEGPGAKSYLKSF